jgi:hypothetical protein
MDCLPSETAKVRKTGRRRAEYEKESRMNVASKEMHSEVCPDVALSS